MDTIGWNDVREEVCQHLAIGTRKGETELDIMTRLIWLERFNHQAAIQKAVAAALDRERGQVIRKARILPWKPRSSSSGLS